MDGPTTHAATTISRRSLLRGLGVAAITVHLFGPGSLPAHAVDTQPDVGEVPLPGGPWGFDGTTVGPPRGSRTNILRIDVPTSNGLQTTWRSGDGRQFWFIPEVDDEVIVGYFDPFLSPHRAMQRTTTVGELEHEIRSHFGDQAYLEITARLRAQLG